MAPRKEWQGRVASWQAFSGIEHVTQSPRETWGITIALDGPDVPTAHDGRHVRVEIRHAALAEQIASELQAWAKARRETVERQL